ncbi:MAG: pentapeptide repeat-containing protein [Faecalibacterium sp.]|uniref:pentapeptide repeat-containing protein n=1 Tax=Faecalibacterium prausnitzii TaxID=853 RepID=UPI0012B11619
MQRPFAILLCTLCALNLGGSGGSNLRRSSLRGSSLGRCSLRGSSLRRSSLGNSGGACGSSLRGGGSRSGRSTTAGGHASSQSQSNNSDANILEFHINDLLSLLVNV